MFRKLMHKVEKSGELPFEFELVSIEVTQPILRGRILAVRWSRHGKSGTSKTAVTSSTGRCFWGDAEGLKFKATLYEKGSKRNKIESKEVKLTIEEVKAGKSTGLGHVKLDLANYVNHDCKPARNSCQLMFEGGLAAGAEMLLTVKSRGIAAGEANSEERSNVGSYEPSVEGDRSRINGSDDDDNDDDDDDNDDDDDDDNDDEEELPPVPQLPASRSRPSEAKAADHSKGTGSALNRESISGSNRAPPAPARPERRGATAATSAAALIQKARKEHDEKCDDDDDDDDDEPSQAPATSLPHRHSSSLLRHSDASVRSKLDSSSLRTAGHEEKSSGLPGAEERRGTGSKQEGRGGSTERANGAAASSEKQPSLSEKQPSLEERRKLQRGIGAKGSREALQEALVPAKNAAALKAAEREVIAQAAVSSVPGGAVAKRKKENRARVGQAILRALDSVQQHEKMLGDLASELDEAEWQRDMSLLIEACILAPPLPPVREDSSVLNGTCYPAWTLLTFMVHHGLVKVNATPPAALASFSGRLSSALVSAAERVDPMSPHGLWAMSNSHLISSMLKTYVTARKDASRGGTRTKGSGLELAVRGAEKAVQILYSRVCKAEGMMLRCEVSRVLEACAQGGDGLHRCLGDLEDGLDAAAQRLAHRGTPLLLPHLRSGIAGEVFSCIDGMFLDGFLTDSRLRTFTTSLCIKEAITTIETWSRKAHPPLADGAILELPYARQASDVILLDKSSLFGPGSEEFRAQACPLLSPLRVCTLVEGYIPDEQSPEPVSAETMKLVQEEIAREQRQNQDEPLLDGDERKRRKGLVVPYSGESLPVADASVKAQRDSIAPLLQDLESFRFLWETPNVENASSEEDDDDDDDDSS